MIQIIAILSVLLTFGHAVAFAQPLPPPPPVGGLPLDSTVVVLIVACVAFAIWRLRTRKAAAKV